MVNHGSAVHHAGFLPPVSLAHAGAASNGCLYGLSSDESFSIYPFERPDDEQEEGEAQIEPPTVFGDVRNFLGCEYVIDVKADGGMDARDPVMAVGNHRYIPTKSPQRLSDYHLGSLSVYGQRLGV